MSTVFSQTCVSADVPANGPCASGPFREFDFWAGEWDVHDANGKLAGRNNVTIEELGCVVVEHWRGANGTTGQSLNYYDPGARKWKQRWAGLAVVLEMDGGMQGDAMVMQGPAQYLGQNRTTILRGSWNKLHDGRVRQQFHESDDGGETWKPWFDGYYTRVRAKD